jgi:hypothetical protein
MLRVGRGLFLGGQARGDRNGDDTSRGQHRIDADDASREHFVDAADGVNGLVHPQRFLDRRRGDDAAG